MAELRPFDEGFVCPASISGMCLQMVEGWAPCWDDGCERAPEASAGSATPTEENDDD
jgi:hypothetical protein